MKDLYKKVYYHAARRGSLEVSAVLQDFMNTRAVLFTDEQLNSMDNFLACVSDSDLLEMILCGNVPAALVGDDLFAVQAVADYLKAGARLKVMNNKE